MKTRVILSLLFLLSFGSVRAADLFIEAESFSNKGGWKVDQQFMDLMGSPYLLAHGMGVPVDDASTEVTFPEKGEYYIDNESHYEYYNRKTKVQNIEMDIAISVTEKEGNKSGIGIAKIINVGTSSENAIQNESVSKIKFSIPLVLPTSNTREYYQKYVKD